jgi:TolA-binding protein
VTVRLYLQVLAVGLATLSGSPRPEQQPKLGPTNHPELAANASDLWLVPPAASRGSRAGEPVQALAAAVEHYRSGDYQQALSALRRVNGEVARDYTDYYRGLAHLRLQQLAEAREVLDALLERDPAGALALNAALAQGEVAEARGDHRAAMAIYGRLAADKQLVNEEVLSRLGRTALAAGDRKRAAEAYVRVYYEFALTDAAVAAASHIEDLRDVIVRTGYKADLGRAAMLFGARRYADARSAFADIRREAHGDDRELAELRIAESDFYLRRYQTARDALRPWLDKASRKAEARFFYLSAIRELGGHSEYVRLTRQLVSDFPDSSWSEEALNNLGTHYILTDDDEAAARTFSELYERFPAGERAERAAWKAGWWNYRQGNHAAAIRFFESAAATFPRSNYRPSFLYWAARSHAKLGARGEAQTRYQIVHQDYGNSYYGRLAGQHIERAAGGTAPAEIVPAAHRAPVAAAPPPPPPTADRIRILLAGGLYDRRGTCGAPSR